MNLENVFLMIGFSCGGSVFYVYFIAWWVSGVIVLNSHFFFVQRFILCFIYLFIEEVIVQPTITFVCVFLDDTIYAYTHFEM